MNVKENFQLIRTSAIEHAYQKEGQNVMIYPCGFASVNFSKNMKDTELGKSLLMTAELQWDPIKKHYYMWSPNEFNQSYSHKVAFAEKLAELLSFELPDVTVSTWDALD